MEYKILFTGAPGAGKTTATLSVSDTAPLSTDVVNSDIGLAKEMTTVGLDYGLVTLDNGDCIRLFGTPGQQRFDFLWKILVKNAMGLVILIDNSRPDPLQDLDVYLDGFAQELDVIPCVIGVGRAQTHTSPSVDQYSARLASKGRVFPVLAVDVRKRADVLLLIDILLMQIESDSYGESVEK